MVLLAPASTRAIFVDASAYVAVAFTRDDHHDEALKIAERLNDQRWEFVTAQVMVAEVHAQILKYRGRHEALQIAQAIYRSRSTTVISPDWEDEQQALQILERYQDKDFSFADTLAFAVAKRLNIDHAWSFDRHFRQYGRLRVIDRAVSL